LTITIIFPAKAHLILINTGNAMVTDGYFISLDFGQRDIKNQTKYK